MMKIKLDLSLHCIETEIRNQYNRRVAHCLKQGLSERLEKEIEGLKYALEHFDFGRLRSHHRELSGGVHQWAVLEIPDVGVPRVEQLSGATHRPGESASPESGNV